MVPYGNRRNLTIYDNHQHRISPRIAAISSRSRLTAERGRPARSLVPPSTPASAPIAAAAGAVAAGCTPDAARASCSRAWVCGGKQRQWRQVSAKRAIHDPQPSLRAHAPPPPTSRPSPRSTPSWQGEPWPGRWHSAPAAPRLPARGAGHPRQWRLTGALKSRGRWRL